MTQTHDFAIRAGNSGTVSIGQDIGGNDLGIVLNLLVDGAPFDLTGQTVIFRVMQGATEVLRKASPAAITLSNGTDASGAAAAVPNRITIPISVAESRTLEAAGAPLTYDVERRSGATQRTIIAGNIFIEPGANDDV